MTTASESPATPTTNTETATTATTEVKPGEVKPGEVKPGEVKPGEVKPGEVKPGEVKPGEVKPGEVKPGEVKPGEVKPGEVKPGEVKPGEVKPVVGAPEKYEAFTAPEGVTLGEPVVTAFADVAKGLNLPQDKAQEVVTKMGPVLAAHQAAQFEKVKGDMMAASQADKEFGGDKLGEAVATAQLAINAHFTPEFKKFLNDTGLGNHPEMIRGLRKIGAQLKADGHVPAGTATEQKGDARSFYPNSNMNN